MKRSMSILSVAVAGIIFLSSCGGGGGGGDLFLPATCAAPTVDVTGTWVITETSTSNSCGEPVKPAFLANIAQSDKALTVSLPTSSATFSGEICGNTVTWSGSYPEDGGTTTLDSLQASVEADGSRFSGTESWRWSDGVDSCSGTTTFTGARQAAAPAVPAAPTDLAASAASSTSIVLSWSDNSSNEIGFSIERSLSAATGFSEIATTGAGATTYTSGGLAASTTYYYRVRAYNSAGNSPYSNTTSAITQATAVTVPATPTNVSVTSITTTSAKLTWQDNSNNETGFEIGSCAGLVSVSGTGLLKCVSGFTVVGTALSNATSYTLSNLSPSTGYSRFVRAKNSAGTSDNLGVSFTTAAAATTVTLKPLYDNTVLMASHDPSYANNVYQTGDLIIGCDWNYSSLTGIHTYVCGRAVAKFDVSSLSGKTIDSATLKLEAGSAGVGYYPPKWHIRAMASSWNPATVTWNILETSTYYIGSEIIQSAPSYAGQTYSIDVKSIAQNWANGSYVNYGLLFGPTAYTLPYITSYDSFSFYSLEDAGRGWPTLTVTYH